MSNGMIMSMVRKVGMARLEERDTPYAFSARSYVVVYSSENDTMVHDSISNWWYDDSTRVTGADICTKYPEGRSIDQFQLLLNHTRLCRDSEVSNHPENPKDRPAQATFGLTRTWHMVV
jgi:hypothetical protein